MVSGNRAGNPPRNSGGYVLFGVLIGVTLMGIGVTAAVTLWSQVVQRDREAELLFRGEAVVRALERFQEDRPGTLPETLDELVEGKYLRRAWLDPMTGRSFRILRAAPQAGNTGAATGAAGAGPPPTNPAGAEERRPAPESRRTDEGAADPSSTGITGVVSTSDLLSFRTYEGARRYSEWRFEAQVSASAGSGTESETEDEERPRTRPGR